MHERDDVGHVKSYPSLRERTAPVGQHGHFVSDDVAGGVELHQLTMNVDRSDVLWKRRVFVETNADAFDQILRLVGRVVGKEYRRPQC